MVSSNKERACAIATSVVRVVEDLECRRLLSAVPVPIADLAIDEALDRSAGGPTSVYAGGTVYFSAVTSRDRGNVELWKTDPATGQSTFVKSFSGGGGLNPTTPVLSSFAPGPGSTAYFVLNVSSGVPQIWRTDGTDAGTFQVYGVNQSFAISTRIPFVRRGNSTYFAAGGICGSTTRRRRTPAR